MKKIGLLMVCMMLAFASAQAQYKFPAIDVSVADITYYPLKAANTGDPVKIKVLYSRPLKKGREILGGVEPFGKVWRAGANESTEIQFFTPVTIGGKQIPAGTYSLFAIPEKDKWTVIINGIINRWGAFTYDQSKDIVRVTVPIKPLNDTLEAFSITFTNAPNGANLVMGWEKTAVEVPIAFKK
jgi:hypothetical protein